MYQTALITTVPDCFQYVGLKLFIRFAVSGYLQHLQSIWLCLVVCIGQVGVRLVVQRMSVSGCLPSARLWHSADM